MNDLKTPSESKIQSWIGRIISLVLIAFLAFGAYMKFQGAGEEFEKGLAHLGLSADLVKVIGIIEIVCVVLYAIPLTSVLGAILITGYMGGAIFAHLRVGDSVVFQVAIGGLAWLGLFLREPRLRALIPFRVE
jgi:hypothetical protein